MQVRCAVLEMIIAWKALMHHNLVTFFLISFCEVDFFASSLPFSFFPEKTGRGCLSVSMRVGSSLELLGFYLYLFLLFPFGFNFYFYFFNGKSSGILCKGLLHVPYKPLFEAFPTN